MSLPTSLFSARSTNGVSAVFVATGGYITLIGRGTFGGGTLAVEASDDGTNWVSIGVSLTSAGALNFLVGDGVQLRLNLTGATSPSVSASVAYCK